MTAEHVTHWRKVAQFFTSVTSSAAQIVGSGNPSGNDTVQFFNPPTSGVTAYLGAGSGVTTSTGLPLTPGSSVTLVNPPAIFGITASSQLVTLTVTQNIS